MSGSRRTLSRAEADRIYQTIHSALGYLTRLQQRMAEVGFTPEDEYFRLVSRALDSVHHLATETYYLSCKEGVGRKARE